MLGTASSCSDHNKAIHGRLGVSGKASMRLAVILASNRHTEAEPTPSLSHVNAAFNATDKLAADSRARSQLSLEIPFGQI